MKAYSGIISMELNINNATEIVELKPWDTLLHVIRERLGATGSKAGCENGDCGACTVLVDGNPIKSCMMLAVEAEGKQITTIEGLKDTAVQDAFISKGGFQCGFCTSGFIINTFAMLETHPDADDEIKDQWLSSNLCRCTGYEGIRDAVSEAQSKLKSKLKLD